MVVCQYFLKGDCRFGDRCKYEHPGPGAGARYGGGGFGGGGGRQTSGNICQHFLRGSCWFGENCKYTHASPNSGQGGFGGQSRFGSQPFGQNQKTVTFSQGGSSFGGSQGGGFNRNQNRFGVLSTFGTSAGPPQSSFGAKSQQTTNEALGNPNQIQQTIQRDMETWDTSKQWPLSCYGFYKDEPCLTGLLDFSPEEIRLEAYKSNADGKAAAYQQGLKDLLEKNKQRRLELKKMSTMQLQAEVKSAKSILSSPGSISLGSQPQPSSVFGGSPSLGLSQSLFSGNTASTGQSSGLFGTSTNTGGIFGSKSLSQPSSTGMFGATSQLAGTVLGSNIASTNTSALFGSNTPATTAPFGTTSQPNPGLFGSGTSTQQSPGNTGFFGSSAQPSALGSGLFGSTAQPSLATGVFGTAQPSQGAGLFGSSGAAQTTGSSLFGSTSSQPGQANQGPASVFGNPSTVQTPSATPTRAASTSKLTCSEQDIAAFKADSFVLGKIPECPPPRELCV